MCDPVRAEAGSGAAASCARGQPRCRGRPLEARRGQQRRMWLNRGGVCAEEGLEGRRAFPYRRERRRSAVGLFCCAGFCTRLGAHGGRRAGGCSVSTSPACEREEQTLGSGVNTHFVEIHTRI